MKKILPIILAFWPYVFLLPIGVSDKEELFPFLFQVYCILTIMIYILNIMNAFHYKSENDIYELALMNLGIKIMHIPFYIGVFVIGLAFALASVVPALVFVTPMLLIVLFIIDLFLMLISSMYGISAIIKARKQGFISNQFVLINTIMHCFFVSDVISAIVLFNKLKKCKRKGINNE